MSAGSRKVVVGFDSRDEALAALRLAQALATASKADLHVAVVLPRGRIPFEWAVSGVWLADELSEQLFEAAERELGGGDFARAALDGGLGGRSAARALFEYARDQEAELIVVGSSHRGPVGRVLPGSVGESLLSSAPCAIAIAPRGFADGELVHHGVIGIGFEGGEESELALAEAREWASLLGARLRVITVVPELAELAIQAPRFNELNGRLRAEYQEILDGALAQLGDTIETEPVLEKGIPAQVLAEQGETLDLLVLGSRGYGPLRAALVGAVSAKVMRTAPCPVLITPRPPRGEPESRRRGQTRRRATGPSRGHQPNALSSPIISAKPPSSASDADRSWPWPWLSGTSSSTTTYSIAPAAKASAPASSAPASSKAA